MRLDENGLLCGFAGSGLRDAGTSSSDGHAAQSSLTLLLCCFSRETPPNWSRWGTPLRECPVVWRFPVRDREHLLDLVKVLSLQIAPQELNKTLALCLPYTTPEESIPASYLSECHPLPVLQTRLHHPWLISDLGTHVESHLQPIVDLQRGGEVFGFEALCRARTPAGKLLSGFETLSLAKQAFCLKEVDLTCIDKALQAKATLIEEDALIFINVLPRNLIHMGSTRHPLKDSLAPLNIPAQQVVIEIVESEQVNPEALVDACDNLRSMGFRIALDDVGSGYNDLSTLATLRPDFVKLDRNLVDGIQGSRVRMVLLEALISMSQRLGCATIAEGLERAEDVLLCQDMGVNYGQGYYFAKPSPRPGKPAPLPIRKTTSSRFSFHGMIRLADYVDKVPTLPITATVGDAEFLLRERQDLSCVVILDDKRPVGYTTRSILSRRAHGSLVVSYCRPVTRILKDRMPKTTLASRFLKDRGSSQPWIVVNEDHRFLGTVEPWLVLSQILAGPDHGELHPLSLLPTGPILRSCLDLQLQAGKEVLLIYIDIDHFKAFNDRYGFIRGDAMIKLLAEIIRQMRLVWPDAFLGHIGGDDYVVMLPTVTPDLIGELTSLVESFHRLSAHLYDSRDLGCGFFEVGEGQCYPVAALSVVVVNGATGGLTNSLKASERAALLKKLAKEHRGSVIVVEGDPVRLQPVHLCDHEDSWQGYAVRILEEISMCKRDMNHHDLDDTFKVYPLFELLYELDSSGVQRYPNWVNPLMRGRIKGGGMGTDRSDQPYFQKVRGSYRPYLSSVYLSTASQDFCVTVSVPLYSRNGDFDGVLVADMNLPGLVDLCRNPPTR